MSRMTVYQAAAGLCVAGDEKQEKDKERKDPVRHWGFDSDKAGGSAAGFKTEVGDWKVMADDSAPPAQTSSPRPPGAPGRPST